MRRWPERYPDFRRIAGVALLSLVLIRDLILVFLGWTHSEGWEYEWIARAWADGKGYSLSGEHRWLFDSADPGDRTDPGGYYPTAWEEPVPTLLLGTFLWLLGDYGRLAMTLANAFFFAATLVVVYRLGQRILGPWLGLISAVLLALTPTVHTLVAVYLGGTVLAGLLVSICALLLLWFLERVSVRRGLVLGAVIGFAALSQASTIVFAPVAALLALLSAGPFTWRAWRGAGVIVAAALLVIFPWTLRNYVTFGELVLVRNGAGLIAHVSSRALAETFDPGLIPADAPFPPPWTARNALHAVQLIADDRDNWRALRTYSQDTMRATGPDNYAELNEAQRDEAFRRDALEFMLRHPVTTLQLATVKAARFLLGSDRGRLTLSTAVVGLLAVLGAAIRFGDRRVRALALLALGYIAVYALSYPLNYRYRYPIEPLFAVLGGVAVASLAQLGLRSCFPEFGAAAATDPRSESRPQNPADPATEPGAQRNRSSTG